ncbi:hypothetical protein CG428_02215 [Pantoea ananatis]|uniref:hypothetical protein n=1 Tax=Pantoea ananas TaxID=553 RepID=UPI000CF4AF64|nr:hypothetical protein [Pantoea ananatis]PQK80195.1 hypothetical protein CG428_02215 [Pantoea ananatis]
MIITWLTFNWEAVAILFFSDMKMDERVRFINSAYPFINLYPFIMAVILTFLLPLCTEKITFFQSKPISRTSTLLAIRKKKMLLADISVERFRAKKDVAYERHKAGEEKQIQDMREAIISSKETTGQLNQELNSANEIIKKQGEEIRSLLKDKDLIKNSLSDKNAQLVHLQKQSEELKSRSELLSSEKIELVKLIENIESKHKDSTTLHLKKIQDLYKDISSLRDLYSFFKGDILNQMRKLGFSDDESLMFINRIKDINEKHLTIAKSNNIK